MEQSNLPVTVDLLLDCVIEMTVDNESDTINTWEIPEVIYQKDPNYCVKIMIPGNLNLDRNVIEQYFDSVRVDMKSTGRRFTGRFKNTELGQLMWRLVMEKFGFETKRISRIILTERSTTTKETPYTDKLLPGALNLKDTNDKK